MAIECTDCKDFLNKNKSKFGIIDNVSKPECLDICTQHVRCIATKQVRANIPLPSINHILNNCRGIVDYPGEIDPKFASFRVTCAKEELVGCNTERPGVRIIVTGQIVVRTVAPGPRLCPAYIAIPVQVVDEVIYHFYSTKDGSPIKNLKEELSFIDGSCMVIQLNCTIVKDTTSNCPRYVARIRGNIVDKLWKRENIWVEGIRPYPTSSLTFCDSFMQDSCCSTESLGDVDDNNYPCENDDLDLGEPADLELFPEE